MTWPAGNMRRRVAATRRRRRRQQRAPWAARRWEPRLARPRAPCLAQPHTLQAPERRLALAPVNWLAPRRGRTLRMHPPAASRPLTTSVIRNAWLRGAILWNRHRLGPMRCMVIIPSLRLCTLRLRQLWSADGSGTAGIGGGTTASGVDRPEAGVPTTTLVQASPARWWARATPARVLRSVMPIPGRPSRLACAISSSMCEATLRND
jgi:hypothetical protein